MLSVVGGVCVCYISNASPVISNTRGGSAARGGVVTGMGVLSRVCDSGTRDLFVICVRSVLAGLCQIVDGVTRKEGVAARSSISRAVTPATRGAIARNARSPSRGRLLV